MITIRKLRPDEIDCRVASVTEGKGCSILLYKDARVDQNILDELFGQFGWKRSHQQIGDRLYCTVSIKDLDTGEWIDKQDVGTESFTEPEKGQASDSFKRACFNWGIGRELYTAPFIWIPEGKCTIKKGRNGKPAVYDRFMVKDIGYSGSIITRLEIINQSKNNVTVFSFDKDAKKAEKEKPSAKKENGGQLPDVYVTAIKANLKKGSIDEIAFLKHYGKKAFKDLSMDDIHDMKGRSYEEMRNWA